MTRATFWSAARALLLVLSLISSAQAQEAKPPEIVAVRVGFAGRYKVGLWTPLEVTLRGGSNPSSGLVRASLSDSDGLNCSYDAATPCHLAAGQDTKALLYVRFGRERSTLALELLHDGAILSSKTFQSASSATGEQYADALSSDKRLIVSVGKSTSGVEKAVKGGQNVVAALDSVARLPTRWEGYEGVDIVVISTSNPEVFAEITPQDDRIEALEQWVRMGGKLVLCAGSHAAEALRAGSPLAKFVPGRFQETVLRGPGGWETYAKSANPIPQPKAGEKVELPTAWLFADVQGRIEAREADVPLVIRSPRGLGQVVFVATDLDRGPISEWNDRWPLVATILDLPVSEQASAVDNAVENYGYNDLAGQLRSALDLPRDVHLVPFYVVAFLVIAYILLIGPGDYFLLRRLGRGMQWTWVTFPAIVVLFSAGAYSAAYWLKGDQLRVSQADLVDIDAEGTARGASWFSIFSPRGESFDLTMRPRLPDGQRPEKASASLAWLGKAGNEFNGMYSRDRQDSVPLSSQGYSIASSLSAIRGVPIQVWASKSFTQRWLGRAGQLGLDASLRDDQRQLSGTIVNRLIGNGPQTKGSIALSRCFLAYDDWAYVIGELKPGETVEIGPALRRISLGTFLSGGSWDVADGTAVKSAQGPYDQGSRNMACVLRAMMFYDAAGGRKWTNMANDYQRFTDLSGLLKAGRAILVGTPPQDGDCRGGDLLRGPPPLPGQPDNRRPLGNALDRHTIIYRFILPVTLTGTGN